MWRSFFIFLFLGIHLAPTSVLSQSTLTNPYLYYYSGKWNAFVVERADGTDSHLLAQDIIPQLKDAYNEVTYAEWSPSGQWLAWIAQKYRYVGGDMGSARGYIINVNGTDLMPLFQGNAVQFSWSPVEDVLFVVTREYQALVKDKFYWVYPDGKIIKAFELDSPFSIELTPYELTWLENAKTIVVGQTNAPNWYLISTNGTVQTQVVHQIVKGIYLTPLGFRVNFRGQGLSPQGRWFYHEQNQLVFADLNTGQRAYFADMPLEYLFWSPDGKQAFLASKDIWLFDLETMQIYKISELEIAFNPAYGNLPILWSSDSNHAVLRTQGFPLLHWSRQEESIQELIYLDKEYDAMQWVNKSQLVIVNADYTHPPTPITLYRYDFANKTQSMWTVPAPILWSSFQINPTGKYFATVGDGPIITDIETGQLQYLRPHYASYASMGGGIVNWDAHGDWLVVIENSSIAGGGGLMTHYGIVNREGKARRDLDGIPQWLPAQVQTENLPQNVQGSLYFTPTQLISDTDWCVELSWSPDGLFIAGRLSPMTENPIHIWDIGTGKLVNELAQFDNGVQIGWEWDGNAYVPIPTPHSPGLMINNQPYVLSPDGTIAISYEPTRAYEYQNGELGKVLTAFYSPLARQTYYIVFSSDGHYVAFGSPWDRVEIWDIQNWRKISTLPNSTTALAFSPDSKTLAVAIAWDIQLWEMDTLPPPY